ncbi:hypothetical protein QBC42DRAFT_331507 [Cladorrhinum samala]|uniref:Uncharacterized protein n=1 Tax=Cladorrhinum samala TaxID=585594 RepID=A0AAV9HJ65_9PEZI|nr:hypothetical protein QBC42DRAFT_331507 [Cladorrhinum samala]
MPNMPSFLANPDITLRIADHADSETIRVLQRVSKPMYSLLTTYQQSTVKSRIQQLISEPVFYPPLGSVISSRGPERHLLKPYSLAVVGELELRNKRIDSLLNPHARFPLQPPPPLIQAMSQIPTFVSLSHDKQSALLELYKTACRLADQISDMAVTIELAELSRETPTDPDVLEKRIHRARLNYIKTLNPLQLALLGSLASLCGMAYAREHTMMNSDPSFIERMTAYEETVLRQGSMALWGFLHPVGMGDELSAADTKERSVSKPPNARSKVTGFVARKVDEVLKEIERYESGLELRPENIEEAADEVPGVLDGLLQTVNGAVRELGQNQTAEDEEQEQELQNVREFPCLRIILASLRG